MDKGRVGLGDLVDRRMDEDDVGVLLLLLLDVKGVAGVVGSRGDVRRSNGVAVDSLFSVVAVVVVVVVVVVAAVGDDADANVVEAKDDDESSVSDVNDEDCSFASKGTAVSLCTMVAVDLDT